jgi:hypothetical protein
MNPNRFSQVVETVTFSNGSTGGNSYFWDFGNGNTSTEFDPEGQVFMAIDNDTTTYEITYSTT